MELFRTTSCQAKVIEMLLDIAIGVLVRKGLPQMEQAAKPWRCKAWLSGQ